MPKEKASRGLKAFVASMACEQAYRPVAAHVAVFSREPVSPAAVKDAVESCAAPRTARLARRVGPDMAYLNNTNSRLAKKHTQGHNHVKRLIRQLLQVLVETH